MKVILENSLTERDDSVVWHPYSQGNWGKFPIGITHGEGSYLYDEDGNRYIDAISSWWVNLHGHCHPFIIKSVLEQMTKLEQVIFAGFTHDPAISLAEKLLAVLPRNQARIFYSDDGSTSVEVAIKMAIQFWTNQEKPRKKILAWKNSYHGDTFGSMSLSSRGPFNSAFEPYLFEVDFINIPKNAQEVQNLVDGLTDEYAAFIFEPIIQGTAGMKIYKADLLNQILVACKKHQIITIADEVMTGFGRTGKLFAMDYIIEKPDIICLSKGLTGGMLPLGVTTCTNTIYQAFQGDDVFKSFFHGHSYTANPLACTAAIASLDILLRRETQKAISRIENQHKEFVKKIMGHPKVFHTASLGTIFMMEWKVKGGGTYFNEIRDKLYEFFISEGVLIRPLGNTVYLMPPYCISAEDLDFIYEKILDALEIF
jgi:adenosylmethionine-8-amino-7-oxononanoate aminotransferase